MNSVG